MNLLILTKQCNSLIDKGITPRVVLMSDKYFQQLILEFPDLVTKENGIHKRVLHFSDLLLGIYTDPIDDYFVKVCGD